MTEWDPARYLQFSDERSRPFVDLVSRIQSEPSSIVDLGCGPGHLSAVLRARWTEAAIRGVDSSAEMIDRATSRNADPKVTYALADVAAWTPDEPVDLIVSNALFQWVPHQLAVIQRLAGAVTDGGTFALQVPNNYSAPSHVLLHEIAQRAPFGQFTAGLHDNRSTPPGAYFGLFAGLGWTVDVWETTYLHVLSGDDPVFDWISGTGARPILAALPDDVRDEFIARYKSALREAYPAQPWGTVLPFARTFVVARCPGGVR